MHPFKFARAALGVILLLAGEWWFPRTAMAQRTESSPGWIRRMPTPAEGMPSWAQRMYEGDPDFWGIVNEREDWMRANPTPRDIHARNFKHWLLHVEHLVDAEGQITPIDDWALKQWKDPVKAPGKAQPSAMKAERVAASVRKASGAPRGTANEVWHPMGPMETYNKAAEGGFPVSWQCNVYCMDQSVSNPDICVAGIEAGDLFKSTDRGLSWHPVTEQVPGIRTVRAVKIAPSDASRMYFEANQWVYATTDGGSTWSMVHNLGEHATQIAVHPTNPDLVHVATWNGLHRSEDGGLTWSLVFEGITWDVVHHPSDPVTMYALRYGSELNRCEMHRSDDGGLNFALKDSGYFVPSDPANASADGGRLGVTPADPDRVYVALIGRGKAEDTGWIGLYQSLDRGDSWANLNGQDGAPYDPVDHPSVANGNLNGTGIYQGFYDFDLAVSHNDPNTAWVGVTALSATHDGGATWQRIGAYSASTYDIGWIHPDIQDLCVLGDDIWVATDGGLNYSQDELATHESRKAGIYNSTFWGFGQGWNVDMQVGGRYHNGNTATVSTYGAGNHLRLGGAEAATGYVHPLDESGHVARFSDITDVVVPQGLGENTSGLTNLSKYPTESYVDSRSSECVVDPRYGNHLVIGQGSALLRSEDGGNAWDVLMDWGENWSVYEIEQGTSDPLRWYVVTRAGGSCKLFRSTNGGGLWTQLTSGLPTSWGSMEIALNPADENDLWVIQASGEGVYRTTTGGASWVDMTQPLWEGEALREVLPLGGTGVLLFSDHGTYAYHTESETWSDLSAGLPAFWAPLEGAIYYASGKVRIADKGKGIWERDLPWTVPPLAQPMTTSPEVFCANDTVVFDCRSSVNHEGASWTWSFSPEPAFVSDASARRVQVVFGTGGVVDVTLTVQDANGGTSTGHVPAMVQVGDASQCAPDGEAGMALSCGGNPQHALTHELGVSTNTFTAMAWVWPDGIQPDYTGIVLGGTSAAGLNVRSNNELGYHWPGGAWWWGSGLTVPPNTWSHVALVVSPSHVKVVLNGVEAVHEVAVDPALLQAMWVGSYRGWASRNWSGLIDEVKMWNRALSLEEIRAHRHLNVSAAEVMADPDLLAVYQFNESASFAVNKVGTSAHGSFQGGASLVPSSAPVAWGEVSVFALPAEGAWPFGLGSWEVAQSTASPGSEVWVHRLEAAPFAAPDSWVEAGGHWVVNAYESSASPVAEDATWNGQWSVISNGDVWGEVAQIVGLEWWHRPVHGEGAWGMSCSLSEGGGEGESLTMPCTHPLEGQWAVVQDVCTVDSTQIVLCPGESVDWQGMQVDVDTVMWVHVDHPAECDALFVLATQLSESILTWAEATAEDGAAVLEVGDGWQVIAWTLNGAVLQGEVGTSLAVNVDGTYGVHAVSLSDGCLGTYEALVGCPGDFNNDQTVGVADVLGYLSTFGCMVDCGVSDLNGDGAANTSDLLFLLALFGDICL